jgi:hypothetical protein
MSFAWVLVILVGIGVILYALTRCKMLVVVFVLLSGFPVSYADEVGDLEKRPGFMPCVVCPGFHAGGPNGEVIAEYCAYSVERDENGCSTCSTRVWCRIIDGQEQWYWKDRLCNNPCNNELMGNPTVGG